MQNKIILRNPIKINNKDVMELTYDANEITANLYTEAEAKKKIAAGMQNVSITPAVEFDFSLHLYFGFAAVIAVNPGYSFEDLERVHGFDLNKLAKVGRDFLMGSDGSRPNDSENTSETTAVPTTPALENSAKEE